MGAGPSTPAQALERQPERLTQVASSESTAVIPSPGADIVASPLDHLWPTAFDPALVAKDDVVRAVFCSHAAYFPHVGEVDSYLKMCMRQGAPWDHALGAFEKILVSLRTSPVKNPFLVAYTADTIYVAFRGTTHDSVSDTLASANLLGRQHSIGYIHAGYAERARVMDYIPLDSLREMGNGRGRRRVIFCGHSLGGAVSHVVLLQYLISAVLPIEKTKNGPPPGSMISIAFGAPHWCDETAAKWIKDRGLAKLFVTFVNAHDPIPSLFEDLRGTLGAGFSGVSRHAYASFGKIFEQLTPWLLEDARLGTAVGYALSLSDRTAMLSTIAPMALQGAQKLLEGLRNSNTVAEEKEEAEDKPPLEPFYCPAGVYIHLRSDADAARTGEAVVLMDNVSKLLFPNNTVKFSSDTLGDHYMTTYSERVVGLLRSHVVPQEPPAAQGGPFVRMASDIPSNNPAMDPSSADAWSSSALFDPYARSIVSQPPPVVVGARYEVIPDQRLAVISIEGENLFFLAAVVEVAGLGEGKKGASEWVVIARGPNGSSLKIGLSLAGRPSVVRPLHGEPMTVTVHTAFGSAVRTRVTAATDMRSPGLATDMWLQSVEAMALMFEQCRAHPPLEFNRAVTLLEALAATTGAVERGLVTRELRRLVDHGDVGAAVQTLDALAPLVECVTGYLSGVWDVELKPELMGQVKKGAFIALLAGGVVLLSTGVLGAGLLTVGAEFAVGEAMVGAAGAAAGAAMTGQIAGSFAVPNNCIRFTDAKKTLENLLDFVGHSYEGLGQEESDQATLERKVVHAAMQPGLNFNTRSVEEIQKTILKGNQSLIAKSGSPKTIEEAIRRVKVLVAVHELYHTLGLAGVTFVAAVGNEDTGKSTLVQGLLDRVTRGAQVPNIGTDLHTNTARAYRMRDKVWLVDFPGLNSANPARRATASTTWSRFGHVAQKAVLVMQFASKPSASDKELLEEVRKRVAGRVLVVLNKADRYGEDIQEDSAYLRERRIIYCDPSIGLGLESEDLLFTVLRPSSMTYVKDVPEICGIEGVAATIERMVMPSGPPRPVLLPPPVISEVQMEPLRLTQN